MRRGMISAPAFAPPGGLRFPGALPMMPTMPGGMPTMPQTPQPPPQPQAQGQPTAQAGGQMPAGFAPQGQMPAGFAPQGQMPAGFAPQGQMPAGFPLQGQMPAGFPLQGQMPAGFPLQGQMPAGQPQGQQLLQQLAQQLPQPTALQVPGYQGQIPFQKQQPHQPVVPVQAPPGPLFMAATQRPPLSPFGVQPPASLLALQGQQYISPGATQRDALKAEPAPAQQAARGGMFSTKGAGIQFSTRQ